MSYRKILEKLIKDRLTDSVLKRGAGNKVEIRALQNLLNELGFGSELNWNKFGADGTYGQSTAAAIAIFAKKNHLAGDGNNVTDEIAEAILTREDILEDLRCIDLLVRRKEVEAHIYCGTKNRAQVSALQTLLHALGYADLLNWDKYGADGHYGNATIKAVNAFAMQESISSNDGKRLTQDLALCMIQKLEVFYGKNWAAINTVPTERITTHGHLTLREVVDKNRPRIYVSDGTMECRFSKFKKGVYLYGKHQPLNFIHDNKSSLSGLGLTDSAINVMASVSENEGNLDAVNTWDNSFMTFGMFQWTLGAGNDKGELPALLKKIKAGNDDVFEQYYGRYGLDIADANDVYGYFLLDGKTVADSTEKEKLRSNQWAFYFWKSAQDPVVQSIQIQHAASRLNIFYHSKSYKIKNYYISDLITSEYGMGLILDNHVNRPGYVRPCLKAAMERTGLEDPVAWGTDEELHLIDNYLDIRNTYGKHPMTDAAKRAAVTHKFLKNGLISAERGSFRYAPTADL